MWHVALPNLKIVAATPQFRFYLSKALYSISLFLLALGVVPSSGWAAPLGWTYEQVPIIHFYLDGRNNTGAYDTADQACVAATPAPYVLNNISFTYSNPRAGVNPPYGFGCFYHLKEVYVSGPNAGQVYYDDPNWFAQNWVEDKQVCPYLFSSSDGATCTRPRPPRVLCCAVGNPVVPGRGYKIQEEADYISPSGGGDTELTFIRQYSSWNPLSTTLPYAGSFGKNWFIKTYGRYLAFASDGGTQYAYAIRALGDTQLFSLQGGLWISEAYNNDRLEQLSSTQLPAAWRYTNASDNSVELYDAAGKLLSITTLAGLVYSLQYSDATTPANIAPYPGLLISISSPFGRSINLSYDATGLLVGMIDPAGQQYLYGYNENISLVASNPLLTSVSFPDGKKRSYVYESQLIPIGPINATALKLSFTVSVKQNINTVDFHHSSLVGNVGENVDAPLTGIIDENGNRLATYGYDVNGRATSTAHAGGAGSATLVYSGDGSTTVTDALGTSRRRTFQNVLGVLKDASITQPNATGTGTKTSTTTYDANGNIASKTDFNGIVTKYAYDLTRNLETSRTEAYGTAQARTITTQWHSSFHLPTLISEPGKTTAYSYDSRGLMTQKTLTDTALGTSRTWTYTYNSLGLLATADGPRTDVSDVTSYSYDSQGNLTSVTNALNQVTQITSYDAHGHPLTIVDPNGLVTTLSYSPRGWLTSRSIGGETTTYTYDGVGQLIKVTLADGSYLTYTYDAAHRLTGISDSLGNRVNYTLDAMGNRTREDLIDPGNVLTQTRSRVYNALNRLAQDIGAQNQTTSYSYDNNGNVTGVTDPLNHTTTNAYDGLNRLVRVTDPNSGVTQYAYDALDHLTRITDPRSLQTNYGYDALDNVKQLISPDTGTTTNTYDAAGNLKTATDARGAVTTYSYDALNRVTQISAALSGSTQTTTFQYDSGPNAIGRLTSISDGATATTYAYNSKGRLSSKTQQVGNVSLTTGYTYDSAGRLSQMTYPSGQIVSYSYDAQGRISALSNGATTILSNIQYSPFGAPVGWSFGNGSPYSRSLDGDGRVASYTVNGFTRTFDYDAASRITAINDAVVQNFSYDNLDRLINYTRNSITVTSESYSYDAVGNRTQLTNGSGTDNYAYAANSNRLTAITGTHPKSYGYTANGNTASDGAYTYSYDARNRLVNAGNTLYTLNGLGQRVQKAGPLGTVNFVYDEQGQLLGEYDTGGNPLQETVYVASQPVAVLKQNSVYYLHTDHLNTPRAISDSNNTVVWRWDSDAFGTTPADEDPDMNGVTFTYNLRFPGQYFDQETGLHYNYFRDYNPSTGRYVESDPVGLAGGLNTYAYVGNSPVSWIDPQGLDAIPGPYGIPIPIIPVIPPDTGNDDDIGSDASTFPGFEMQCIGLKCFPTPLNNEKSNGDQICPTPETHQDDFIKLKGDQGWKHRKKDEFWKKDKLHKDHWDVSDRKGNKKKEVDFGGTQIWPGGPKNRNKE